MDNDENESLVPNNRKKWNWKLVIGNNLNLKSAAILVGFLSVVALGVVLVAKKVNAYNAFKPCFVPQYDNKGKLMKSIPCSLAMGNVFTSVYLPGKDIYSTTMNGMKIFKPFKNNCFITTDLRRSSSKYNDYSNTQAVYHKISSETNVGLAIAGRFTMGATLNAKTESLSAGKKNVMGSSIEIFTHTRSIALDENCYKSSSELTDDILKDFDDLPENLYKPWLPDSWQIYDRFFKKFGTHLRTEVLMGSSVRQWNFVESSESLTIRALKVKACFNFLGLANLKIGVTIRACSDVSDEEYEKYSKIDTSGNLEVRGGTDATRNALDTKYKKDGVLDEQINGLIEKLLNEGREKGSPINVKYQSIWDIFLIRFKSHGKRHKIAMNMKQYYMGYKDFGCTYIKIGGIAARKFQYGQSDSSFECVLAREGCHGDGDCHGRSSSSDDKHAYCYGNTCLEYTKPPFGSKAMSVSRRYEQKGKHNEGINRGCYFIPQNFQI